MHAPSFESEATGHLRRQPRQGVQHAGVDGDVEEHDQAPVGDGVRLGED